MRTSPWRARRWSALGGLVGERGELRDIGQLLLGDAAHRLQLGGLGDVARGIAGMDRLVRFNVLAMSGRAVEAAPIVVGMSVTTRVIRSQRLSS
jgi:hypothetical protein